MFLFLFWCLIKVGFILSQVLLSLWKLFWLVFCSFDFLWVLSFARETFLILLNVKGYFCFVTVFHCSLLIPYPMIRSFHPPCCHDSAIACIWRFSFLYPFLFSIFWYFLFLTQLTQLAIRSMFRRQYRKK